jgi:hypothetical protein
MTHYTNRQWRIEGELIYPTFDDVQQLLTAMVDDLKKSDYDSIESGGILVKKDGYKIDVYVHMGELNEDNGI